MEEKESRTAKVDELIEKGKQKGVLTYKEVMDTLEEVELDSEHIEGVYDKLEALNIDVVEDNAAETETVEDMTEIETQIAAAEGISVDDPVRMYLK